MKIRQYDDAKQFLEKVEPFLLQKEVVNNLPLGVLNRLVKNENDVETDFTPYFATVEEDGKVRFVMVMTPPKNLIIYGEDECHSEIIETVVRYLKQTKTHIPGVIGPRKTAEHFAKVWAEHNNGHLRMNMEQRIYKLEKVNRIRRSQGNMRPAVQSDLALVSDWIQAFSEAAMEPVAREEADEHAEKVVNQGVLHLWEHERKAVSMASQSRSTKHCAVVSLVYTPPEFEKKGYATTCVADLSQSLLDKGYKFCSLYTDLSNPTSNGIYMKIGYEPVEDSIVYDFVQDAEDRS